jgi:hypothetical protein
MTKGGRAVSVRCEREEDRWGIAYSLRAEFHMTRSAVVGQFEVSGFCGGMDFIWEAGKIRFA